MTGRLRTAVLVLGALATSVGVLGVVARSVTIGWQPMIVLAAFFPALAVSALLGGVLFTVGRWWPGAVVAAAVVAWTGVVQAPLFAGASPRSGAELTVLQANLMVGEADAASLVERVRSSGVDLLTVEELTPDALGRLTDAGLDEALPHRLVATFPGGAGAGIWSATPLRDTEKIEDFSFELLGATITPDGAPAVHVVAVHLLPPWPYPSRTWTSELDRLHERLRTIDGPVVAAGDFNATLDHPQFRRLLTDGFHDAAEQSGAGWQPTYPTDKPGPPFLTLDHVVTRGAGASHTDTVDLDGSDHRGLLVTLRITG